MNPRRTWLGSRKRRIASFAFALSVACSPCWAQSSPPASPEFSVYTAPGCAGRKMVPAFEEFSGRKVVRVVDALNQQSWDKLRSSIPWAAACWKDAGFKLTLSVPLLTNAGPGTLADGAAGKYDDIFIVLGRTLVENNLSDAVLRIGWEFNGEWMPWRADRDPESYKAYFRRVVTLMRGVPGQHFEFEWTTGHGRHAIDPTLAYPGDDYVDVVGMDVYDQIWNEGMSDPAARWAYYVNGAFGLAWQVDFARTHGKRFAYGEWGIGVMPDGHGSGDDPYFVTKMAEWFSSNGAYYQSYWDATDPIYDAKISGGRFPLSAKAFRDAFAEKKP